MNYATLLFRLVAGWFLFYAGWAKITNPDWTAAGYIKGAKTLPGLFSWLASPENIGWVNFLNEWGLLLAGIGLIIGGATRFSAIVAAVLMFLYYLPVLDFPMAGAHGYIVDDHIFYVAAFIVLAASSARHYMSVDARILAMPGAPQWLKRLA